MSLLEELRGGLVVSVQAPPGSALDDPQALCAIALAAQESGAAAIRAQGAETLALMRRRLRIPLIGLIKRVYDGFEPYITPTSAEVAQVLKAGAQIVAFDATARPRPGGAGIDEIVRAIHAGGAMAMADCALASDGAAAREAGAEIVATTLCGYTEGTRQEPLPALGLLRDLRALGAFTICEGGIHDPEQARAARMAGADAVCVGTAITGINWLVQRFLSSL